MTEDKCKYKFQDKDKFNGKEYCTLFNEVCENVSFVCDKNCQIYDDYKQLQELKQENKELSKQLLEDKILDEEIESLSREDVYHSALEEIREIANENNFCASYACPPMFKILDKINEVINENN